MGILYKVMKIKDHKLYRGGMFKYIFFKSLADGKSFKSCIGVEFRNYKNWMDVKVGDVVENLIIKSGTLIDADSIPKKVLDVVVPVPKAEAAKQVEPGPAELPGLEEEVAREQRRRCYHDGRAKEGVTGFGLSGSMRFRGKP